MRLHFSLLLSFLLLLCLTSNGQEKTAGWYHLRHGAQTKLLQNFVDQNSRDLRYNVDEALLLFEIKGIKGYAVDIDGRILEIQDTAYVRRITTEGRVVKMVKDVSISLSKTLGKNNNVWIVGFNSLNNSAKVQLSSGEVVEIPRDAYQEISEQYVRGSQVGFKVQPTQ
ncbi:MAG: hypothetical protein EOO10_15490 [Chitinophagaceae bacterium]|nr:MAG: hypothetical protein EOO10_15490 [Chitinophagaceae bacterium]